MIVIAREPHKREDDDRHDDHREDRVDQAPDDVALHASSSRSGLGGQCWSCASSMRSFSVSQSQTYSLPREAL
jgi:hypothetical protein